ncbi:MAG: hypothetical protein APF77_17780 [Clostridia bacterium BRH_c25]|nr:MAG: hypothetical protein APF77_17780 [Clostridia bacterium BRH_c25]
MLPELTYNSSETNETQTVGKSFLFDFDTGEFVLRDGKFIKIEGAAAIKQWVHSTLQTEKYKYLIYQNHGIELESLVERQLPYKLFTSEAERAIREALEIHDNIKSVTDFGFERLQSSLKVTFTVNLTDGLSFGGDTLV